jgi:type I restriction enzyme M protein
MVNDFTDQTKALIDDLKSICAIYGLGNDGNEYKIITQMFLYKFMNDKFGYELRNIDKRFQGEEKWEKVANGLSKDEYTKLLQKLPPSTAKLKKEHYLSFIFNSQNVDNFAALVDSTLLDISLTNANIFSVSSDNDEKINLFVEISKFVTDPSKQNDFCKSLVNKLVNVNFNAIFNQKFDFFSTIFEYLIQDYNKDGGGKYAEYYTPHAVAKIMAKILVNEPNKNVTIYDPSAGSGTLLMNVAHELGEKNCTIYSQDISQKSSSLLRLNLILNNLVHSIPNVIQGNTLSNPHHKEKNELRKFDFIVSNPPFKLDFSEYVENLTSPSNHNRFFAGVPSVPAKDTDQMPVYLMFIQHILYTLKADGRAAVVVPTGFLTGPEKIAFAIRKHLVEKKYLAGVISMPQNIFATTGTNVSVLVVDKSKVNNEILMIDASKLGKKIKDTNTKKTKTVLSEEDENLIIETFINNISKAEFSKQTTVNSVIEADYAFNPSRYTKDPDLDVIPISQLIAETKKLALEIGVEMERINTIGKKVTSILEELK